MSICFLFPASGHPHCFFCHLELGSDREVPSSFVRYVDVEFDMPTTSASKATVRSISVEDKTDVRKWVNYSAHYSYKVKLRVWQSPWLLCVLHRLEKCGQTNKIPWADEVGIWHMPGSVQSLPMGNLLTHGKQAVDYPSAKVD